MRSKLVGYALNVTHRHGGPKARGSEKILGITLRDTDHLEHAIQTGILTAPIIESRPNPPHGITCAVDMRVGGVGDKSNRSVAVRTIWEITDPAARPRLVSAFPRP